MKDYKKIGERIRLVRKEKRLTQDVFADKLGLTKNFISLIETGGREPSDRTLADICRIFSVSEEWLHNGIGDKFIIPEDETAALVEDLLTDKDNVTYRAILSLVKTYQQLSPESKKIVDKFIHDAIENEKNREA